MRTEAVIAETVPPETSQSFNRTQTGEINARIVSFGTPVLKNTLETGETSWRIFPGYKVKPLVTSLSQPSAESTKSVSSSIDTDDNPSVTQNDDSAKTTLNEGESIHRETSEQQSSALKEKEKLALDRFKANLARLQAQYKNSNNLKASATEKPVLIQPQQLVAQSVTISGTNTEVVTEEKTALNPQTTETSSVDQPIIIPVPAPETGIDTKNEENSSIENINSNTTASNHQTSNSTNQTTAEKEKTEEVYRVRIGDTLASIAQRYGLTRAELMVANDIDNPEQISIGQILVVPVDRENQIKSNITSIIPTDRPSPVSTSNFATTTEITSTQENTVVETVEETNSRSTENTHLEKLNADIQKIRQEYQNNSQNNAEYRPVTLANNNQEAIQIEVPVVIDTTVSKNDREQNNYSNNTTQTQTNPTSGLNHRRKEEQIATNSSDGSNYNPSLNTPIGTQVEPDLPPLSSPEEYLPTNQPTANTFIWPTKGVLTSGFGRRWGRMHKGIDIGAPIGTPIVAVADGEVITAGWNSGGFGNLVKIKHPDGTVTLYAHNNRVLVRTGQVVQQGEQISELGNTGRSTGPHLHFEIHPQGQAAVNPISFLPKKKK
jgi:murein DD-endopeptidase MepM/ murein hydrolase activator NlpD